MSKNIFLKLSKKPFSFLLRTIYKFTVGKLIYYKKRDYNAAKYWEDRFSKYGLSLQGAGDEGLPEEENQKMYSQAAKVFEQACQEENIDFHKAKLLEIGTGTGFYTSLLVAHEVKDYTGIDITDTLFNKLREKYPNFKFIKQDITTNSIEGKFDVIIMIDVIEHIVNKNKFSCALNNIKSSLKENGVFILAPISKISKSRLFYLKTWSLNDLEEEFNPGHYSFSKLIPFRNEHLVIIKPKI